MIPHRFHELVRHEKLGAAQGQLAELETFLGRAAGALKKVSEKTKAATQRLQPVVSDAVESVRENLTRAFTPGAEVVAESAAAALDSVTEYKKQSHQIMQEYDRVCERGEQHLRQLQKVAREVAVMARVAGLRADYEWQSGPPAALHFVQRLGGTCPVPAGSAAERVLAERWASAAQEWRRCAHTLEQDIAHVSALAGRHRQAEAVLIAALSFTPLGSLRGVLAAGGAALAAGAVVVGGRRGEWLEAGARVAFGAAFGSLYGAAVGVGVDVLRDFVEMLRGGVAPAEVAGVWERLGEVGVDRGALLREFSWELAGVEGLPFVDRSFAAERALSVALGSAVGLAVMHKRSGQFAAGQALGDFRDDLAAIARAAGLRPGAGKRARRRVIALGVHAGAVTAAVCEGDISRAKQLAVFVQGMNSSVRDIGAPFAGLRRAVSLAGVKSETALVSWIGYHSPNFLEETRQERADLGGERLARFLDGVAGGRGGSAPDRLLVIGHSYGTNVAAVGLSSTAAHVDAFVTIGSAGLRPGTYRELLNVDEVYATHAWRDFVAVNLGQVVTTDLVKDVSPLLRVRSQGRVDPRKLAGAEVFSSGDTPGFMHVTGHSLRYPITDIDGDGKRDRVGYLDPESSTVGGLAKIFARGSGL